MHIDHNIVSLFEYIPKPPVLLILFLQHSKHSQDSVLLQGSVELTHQDPQKNPINPKGSPKMSHVTKNRHSSTRELLIPTAHPPHPIRPPAEMGFKTVL